MGIRPVVKSSGVLLNLSEETFEIIIFVTNLNKNNGRRVKVEIFNWTTNLPVEMTVFSFKGPDFILGDGGPIEIDGGTTVIFASDILVDFTPMYEVRVTFFDSDENVLVTSNGNSRFNSGNVAGQTVLDTDFRILN